MPDFKIVFSGLMCHVEINGNTRAAAMIRDNKHAARIWVKAGDVRGDSPTFHEAPSVGQWRVFTISNDARIQLDGLQQGTAPDLPPSRVPGFTMADEIRNTQQHPWVRGYLLYSGGTFSTASYHGHPARFDDGQYYCRARELMLSTISIADTIEIIDVPNHRRMTVTNDATIGFTHLDTAPSLDHRLYKNMSKQIVGVKQMDIDQNTTCPNIGPILPFDNESRIIDDHFVGYSISVECMSTQWP